MEKFQIGFFLVSPIKSQVMLSDIITFLSKAVRNLAKDVVIMLKYKTMNCSLPIDVKYQ